MELIIVDDFGAAPDDPFPGMEVSDFLAEIKPSRPFACKKIWGPLRVRVEWLLDSGGYSEEIWERHGCSGGGA